MDNQLPVGAVVPTMQQLQLAVPRCHYVGGSSRTSISIRQDGARAALEKHLM